MKYDFKDLVTIDYETFYSTKYSLRAKIYNTSSYITDPEFLIHCCAIKIGTAKSKCYPRDEAIKILQGIDWSCHDLLAHNNFFDGFISAHHLGIKPRRRFCTLQMTRGLHSDMSRAGLQAVCEFYGIPGKIEGLEDTKGKKVLTKDEMKRLMVYCNNDNEKCFQIFKKQIVAYSEDEIDLIDLTLAMFCDPVFQLDIPRAEKSLDYEMNARLRFIAMSGHDEKTLTSTPKFVAALEALGVTAPCKVSKYNGEVSYALAETDADFVILQEHDDMRVVRLVQGRLAAKSTMMETRAWRLIQMQQSCGALPVLLNYYGTKTGRWSGGNKCLAGDTEIIIERDGVILYSWLSSLTESDKVWDGVEFVSTSGLIHHGEKGVMTYGGITATPDHEVFVNEVEGQVRLGHAEDAGYTLKVGSIPGGMDTAPAHVPSSEGSLR